MKDKMKTKDAQKIFPKEIVATEPGRSPVSESYHDIKNRAPDTIKTWQELADGYMDDSEEEVPEYSK